VGDNLARYGGEGRLLILAYCTAPGSPRVTVAGIRAARPGDLCSIPWSGRDFFSSHRPPGLSLMSTQFPVWLVPRDFSMELKSTGA
jgi:hypothetical protein